MKKTGLILTLIVFVIFGMIGFKVASLAYPSLAGALESTSAEITAAEQQNLLLVHIDNLQTQTPQLVSVWAIFLLYSDTPGMVFMPALVVDPRQPGGAITSRFAIQSDGMLAPAFTRAVREELKIEIDGYVILDDEALRTFAQHFPGEEPTPRPYEDPRPTEDATILSLCAYLRTPEARAGAALPWGEVLPHHFRTDLLFDPFMANWIRLTQAPNPATCEIVAR